MSLKQHFELMAEYNRWMNGKVYGAAGNLSKAALLEDRSAFFGSILGTLNHIVVGDTIWLKRFAAHPASAEALRGITELAAPKNLNQIIFEDLDELYSHRKWLDEKIIKWISGLTDSNLDFILSYQNTKGVPATKRFSWVNQIALRPNHIAGLISLTKLSPTTAVRVTRLVNN